VLSGKLDVAHRVVGTIAPPNRIQGFQRNGVSSDQSTKSVGNRAGLAGHFEPLCHIGKGGEADTAGSTLQRMRLLGHRLAIVWNGAQVQATARRWLRY